MNWDWFCRNADRLLFRHCINNPHINPGGLLMSQATFSTIVNGVNVDRLGETVQAITSEPALGRGQFRARNRWISGGHNRSSIQGFYAAGQEDVTRTKPFVLVSDEPPVLLGEDHGANPAEYVLHALAACLTTSLVYHAAARGIRIDSLESSVEGDLDLQGFLGLSERVRKGYQSIRVNFVIQSDASAEELKELTKFSPVYDTLSNPVPVSIEIVSQPLS
jgi:uncharacterized OsmC-like protein